MDGDLDSGGPAQNWKHGPWTETQLVLLNIQIANLKHAQNLNYSAFREVFFHMISVYPELMFQFLTVAFNFQKLMARRMERIIFKWQQNCQLWLRSICERWLVGWIGWSSKQRRQEINSESVKEYPDLIFSMK